MIQLQINSDEMFKELNLKANALESLKSEAALDELSQAIFQITGKAFVNSVDIYARQNPKSMHHVYEWGSIGMKTGRLFVIRKESIGGGILAVASDFLQSRKPVPISPDLLIPGTTGKKVTRRSVFKNKASVMESGKSVSYIATRIQAFMGENGLIFIRPGTAINIKNPGGIATKNAFANYMLEWYSVNAGAVVDSSGLAEKLAADVSAVLNLNNTGAPEVLKAIKAVTNLGGLEEVIA